MFSIALKKEISEKIQKILQETNHDELPEGEIKFILQVDGAEGWSWANITNNSQDIFVPDILDGSPGRSEIKTRITSHPSPNTPM